MSCHVLATLVVSYVNVSSGCHTFILQTDASNRGIGGILSQLDEENIDRPVAYYSRKLLPREERYSMVEKECLASNQGRSGGISHLSVGPRVHNTNGPQRSNGWTTSKIVTAN